jgi:hypothetical protein
VWQALLWPHGSLVWLQLVRQAADSNMKKQADRNVATIGQAGLAGAGRWSTSLKSMIALVHSIIYSSKRSPGTVQRQGQAAAVQQCDDLHCVSTKRESGKESGILFSSKYDQDCDRHIWQWRMPFEW